MRHRTKREMLAFVLILAAIIAVFLGRLWKTTVDRSGPGPAEPFRIAGNFYYVGADAVSAFLITGPEGHVVLDGGYPSNGPMIIASIAQLGFDIKDVKVLLNSIPRREHAGGLAALQQASGAELWASESSASVIASGGDDPDIALPLRTLFQLGILGYPPGRVHHRFKDGDTIRLGPIALTAHVTGGSTRGCTSWSFSVRDGERVLNVVSACPLGGVTIGMRYPEQRADIERSLRMLRSLPADIWVTSSSRSVGLLPQVRREQDGKEPGGCLHRPGGLPRLHRHRRGGIPPGDGALVSCYLRPHSGGGIPSLPLQLHPSLTRRTCVRADTIFRAGSGARALRAGSMRARSFSGLPVTTTRSPAFNASVVTPLFDRPRSEVHSARYAVPPSVVSAMKTCGSFHSMPSIRPSIVTLVQRSKNAP